jgi:dolichol kinase
MIDPALLSGIIKLTILLLIQYASGCLVFYKGVKVNYTRKINHFALFFIPMFIDNIIPVQPSIELLIIGSFVAIGSLIIYIKPIRTNSRLIQRMFLSFDRPEDRPNTLLWLTTQTAVGYLIVIPIVIYFFKIGYEDLLLIPILVNGIGDGLAEPVGVRFGRLKYKTYAIFSKIKYERTIEGSACVFFTSIIVIIFFQSGFTSSEFICALIVFPIVMTLAEALAPHTWDTPFLFLFGYLTLYIVKIMPFVSH